MGWTGDFASKKDAIAYARANNSWSGTRTIYAEKSTKQAYYMVVDDEEGKPYIAVTIFEGRAPRICIKEMDEAMGPSGCTDCPLSFLDMVPSPGGYADDWRERVRRHWVLKTLK